ncbi:hypothetical protein MMC07_006972 [Pseudocyphellaria aurata]|nr:hypothetical protein [Pseudocyphellaria aurata]
MLILEVENLEAIQNEASGPTSLLSSEWTNGLQSEQGVKENHSYYWGNEPTILSSNSSPEGFTTGTGHELYVSTILPAFESAKREIIFVTCFWTAPIALRHFSDILLTLSRLRYRRFPGAGKLRVRLCFSSRSFRQKLYHTSSPNGYIYPPSQWELELGLPMPGLLYGLDLQVKSIFVLPFSVMHPKFIIIDRERALLPSCNLSHESWLECCISLTGPIVSSLFQFWRAFWGHDGFSVMDEFAVPPGSSSKPSCPAVLLPSPYHRFPLFRPLLSPPPPPPTPLNTMLLHLLSTAKRSVFFLTPNLTSPPLLSAIIAALANGISITIITNRYMMVAEQLLTAGTITELCIWRLLRKYRILVSRSRKSESTAEAGNPKVGRLKVGYFIGDSEKHEDESASGLFRKSHVKCTLVDGGGDKDGNGAVVVLGSGNMDRASWFTSQELGVAIEDPAVVRDVWRQLNKRLESRVEGYYGWEKERR